MILIPLKTSTNWSGKWTFILYSLYVHTKKSSFTTSFLKSNIFVLNIFNSSLIHLHLQIFGVTLLNINLHNGYKVDIFEELVHPSIDRWNHTQYYIPRQRHDISFLTASLEPKFSRKSRSSRRITCMQKFYSKTGNYKYGSIVVTIDYTARVTGVWILLNGLLSCSTLYWWRGMVSDTRYEKVYSSKALRFLKLVLKRPKFKYYYRRSSQFILLNEP